MAAAKVTLLSWNKNNANKSVEPATVIKSTHLPIHTHSAASIPHPLQDRHGAKALPNVNPDNGDHSNRPYVEKFPCPLAGQPILDDTAHPANH